LPSEHSPESERERRVNHIIAAYLEAERLGQTPDRDELLRRHPDLADELRSFFANKNQLDRLAGPLRSGEPPTGPQGPKSIQPATRPVSDPAWEDPLTGTRVRYLGDYVLLKEIARGGMGVVWRARQISLKRLVALKMILVGQLATPEEVQRFRSEAEAGASLDHPNIVPIYEVGEHQGQHYFSMKLIEGGSLARYIPHFTKNHRAAAHLLAQVARAVHYAHQHGILHRDLKPGNIILDLRKQPHVTDFGLAKRIEGGAPLTQTGAVVGTPSYMAPEQAAGRRLTTATDLYSLGAILYELLTGRPPFRGETPLETLRLVQEREPERPRAVNPQAPLDLETICLKCLQKEPEGRYVSAQALADDLEDFVANKPISARPVGRAERMWRWCRRNPVVAGLLATAALLLVAVGVAAAVSYVNARAAEAAQIREEEERAERFRQEAIAKQARNDEERQKERARKADEEKLKQEKLAQQERGARQQLVYQEDMRLARAASEKDDINRMRELLDKHRPPPGGPDYRSQEWHDLASLTRRLLFNLDLRFNDEPTNRLSIFPPSWSPDGRWWSPDGRWLTVVVHETRGSSSFWAVRIWDMTTGQERKPIINPRVTPIVIWSPDARRLALVTETFNIWVPSTGKEAFTVRRYLPNVRPRDYDPWRQVAWSSDGQRLAAESDMGVKIWDAATGKETVTLSGTIGVSALAWSPNGRQLAVTSTQGAIVWDVVTAKDILVIPGAYGLPAWNPDSRRLAVMTRPSDEQSEPWMVKVLDVVTAKESLALDPTSRLPTLLREWSVTSSRERMLVWSPDGQQLGLIAGSDLYYSPERQVLKVWDAGTGHETLDAISLGTRKIGPLTLRTPDDVRHLLFSWSPDGRRVAGRGSFREVTGLTVINYWQAVDVMALIGAFASPNLSYSSVPSLTSPMLAGLRLEVIVDWAYNVKIWDLATGTESFKRNTSNRQGQNTLVDLAWSLDNRRLAALFRDPSGNQQERIVVWDAATGKELLTLPGFASRGGNILTWSRDGQRLALAYTEGIIKIYDVALESDRKEPDKPVPKE
jgi:WD40 repeat protein